MSQPQVYFDVSADGGMCSLCFFPNGTGTIDKLMVKLCGSSPWPHRL